MSFGDDPLRMVRAARFVAQLDVDAAPRVVAAIEAMRERLRIVSAERIADELSKLLDGEHPTRGLELLVETELADDVPARARRARARAGPRASAQGRAPPHVRGRRATEPDEVLRLAALLHDVGKPATRQITPEGVQFHHHEVVGARMAEKRLRELRYPNHVVDDVRTLVEMHLRFHGYGDGWSDAAVRRYVRDAGPLLDKLNQLTRADVTTRNERRAAKFQTLQDELEERIARLAEQENLDALRPPLDGKQVMDHLGIEPGPEVGEALAFLMELRMERGPIPEDEAFALLDGWGKEGGDA